jgi:adenylosuccinate lyase
MRAERICGLARHVITLAQDPAFTAATQWLERTLDDSSNRRVSAPDAYLSLDGALVLTENVSSRLVVNPMVIQKNLEPHLPFMATETILMQATARGGDRQELHERIRKHALEAARIMKEEGADSDLMDRIADDDAFGLSGQELSNLLDPIRFTGRSAEQVDRFLARWVDPVLDRYGADLDARIGAPTVRV